MSYTRALVVDGSYTKDWQYYGMGSHPRGATIVDPYTATSAEDAYNEISAMEPVSGYNLGDVAYVEGSTDIYVFVVGNGSIDQLSTDGSFQRQLVVGGVTYFDNTLTATLNPMGGSGGTASVTVYYKENMPSATAPTRTNYGFYGYFNSTSGGTKYYNSNMTSAHVWDFKWDRYLYAQWYPTTFYNAGTEIVPWSDGYLTVSGYVAEGASSVTAACDPTKTVEEATWATTGTIDLTNISTLYITWSATVGGTVTVSSNLCVSTSRTDTYSTYTARASVTGAFSSTTTSLDVSGLSGNYYIRVHMHKGSSANNTSGITTITKVWGV